MERIRRLLTRGLAVLAAPALVLGVVVPASSAAQVPGWSEQAELSGPAGEFGQSVAVSAAGTTALVGVPNLNTGTGAVSVFTLRHGHWYRTAELTAADGAQFSDFGGSLALSASGTTALVGAKLHNKNTGAAYVFTLRRGHWHQSAELTAADATSGDDFGFAVALSATGGTALISAIGHHSETGAAYVYTLHRSRWSQAAELTAADAAKDNDFGQSVALSAAGATAVVGDSVRHADSGAAYVFTLRRGRWYQSAELTGAAGDGFGFSVALSAAGTTILAGAPFHSTPAGSLFGAAYVETLRHGRWAQTAKVAASDGVLGGDFGSSVALSAAGTIALASASEGSSFIGAAYVFTLRHSAWSQTAKLSDGVSGDGFGRSLALSAPGTSALVGAPFRNDSAGAVYVLTDRRAAW